MTFNLFKRLSASLALGLALLLGGAAHAGLTFVSFDVTGIESHDELGAAANETRQIQVGAGSRIVSLDWGVDLTANSPSWLSEMSIRFSDGGAGVNWFEFSPGFGEDDSGSMSFVDFADLVLAGVDFSVSNSGFLHLEFFEVFDDIDASDGADGIWNSGSLRIGVMSDSGGEVPEPGSMALVALAMVAGGAASRRRAKRV